MDKQEREGLRTFIDSRPDNWRGTEAALVGPLRQDLFVRLDDFERMQQIARRLLDAAEQRAALETEQRSRWTRQVAALLGDFDRRDQVRRSVDLDDASLLARAVELLRAMMPLGGQTSEGGADADR